MEDPTTGMLIGAGGGATTALVVAGLPDTGVGAGAEAAVAAMGHYLILSAIFGLAAIACMLLACAVMRVRA